MTLTLPLNLPPTLSLTLSLTHHFTGSAATEQARQDKISELHPANSARAELRYLMTTTAPMVLDDLFTAGPGPPHTSSTSPLIVNDPLNLTQWGIPLRVVNRYASLGVTKMFPWQIACLGVDDGKVLRGGTVYYSYLSPSLSLSLSSSLTLSLSLIACLGVDDGKVLRGGTVYYSYLSLSVSLSLSPSLTLTLSLSLIACLGVDDGKVLRGGSYLTSLDNR
jgi:hypothetical protein